MSSFAPKLEILPPAQRRLWDELGSIPRKFVLYDGTALALRLGHRTSVGFDFFSSEDLDRNEMNREVKFLENAAVIDTRKNTLTVEVKTPESVKVSFFGGLTFGRIGEPERTGDDRATVASLADLAGTKIKVLQERAEAKDYRDIVALLNSGMSLAEVVGAGTALYENQLNPLIAVKALTYFEDGDLPSLTREERGKLLSAVKMLGNIETRPKISPKLHA